jgi:hypothetical protein
MPTPATRTPVRIARGSYSNLNGSVSDLQDGEISYAEDQDKLYIKEGSSLVALTYTPASPAFTGTITGVNLTLSGNLTVNGTQTIINTQTLDVEDKQIEIGKVSSPSDTTADQGGWKLKGGTDKTFLWVNATDAWTSSEHIHLLDNKKLLLGTDSDFQLYHNGSDAFIVETLDDLTLTAADDIYLRTQAGEISIHCKGDGAIDLYHDASRKMYTSSAGITVEGTCTATSQVVDSKGDLRSIPRELKSAAYTLVLADAGKTIATNSGVTVPNNVMGTGDAVTIVNNSGSDITITQASSLSMYNAADASTGNRTLAGRGMATVWFSSGSEAYISGAGLS